MRSGSSIVEFVVGVCFVSFLNASTVTGQTTEDLDNLLLEIFGPNPNTGQNKNNINCHCVPMNQCYIYNNSVITSGEGLIDIRINQCANSLDICCDEVRGTQVTTPPTIYHRTVACGYRNVNGVGFRITAGNSEAQFGEFPWMVAVMQKTDDGPKYHCGGSLIHLRVVLTAAHCVVSYARKPEQIIIRAGEWDSQSQAEIIPYQERTAESIIVHKKYQSGPLYNDIALIILKDGFEFAENVDVICLPTQDENMDYQKCVASGWGKDSFEKGVYQNILKMVKLPIVPRDRCVNLLRTTRLGSRFVLHDSVLCAGGEPGIDTCKGDGGSPLVCPIPGRPGNYQQAGIVSWGIGCGNTVPGVYVSVPKFRNWIDDLFFNNSLDTSFYQN